MCLLQEPPLDMEISVMEGNAPIPKVKKGKKTKPKTGVDVVQEVLKTPNPQMIVNEPLPSYEEMMQACRDLNNLVATSMETQPGSPVPQPNPPQEPLYYTEEGLGVLPDGTEVEWWHAPKEEPKLAPELEEYLMNEKKPLHTVFVLEPNSGKKSTCPVFFGRFEQKHTVLNKLCHEIHPKIQQSWGAFACFCGLVPKLKLSQTEKNPNKVFLTCPKVREARCNFFQWIHQAPKPVKVPKASSPSELKKRVNEMAQESMQKRVKEEQGGFQFP